MGKRLVVTAAIMLLAGCSFGPGEAETLAAPWMKREIVERPATVYCYRTIGDEDCHRLPLIGEHGRLTGFYGPPPELLAY